MRQTYLSVKGEKFICAQMKEQGPLICERKFLACRHPTVVCGNSPPNRCDMDTPGSNQRQSMSTRTLSWILSSAPGASFFLLLKAHAAQVRQTHRKENVKFN